MNGAREAVAKPGGGWLPLAALALFGGGAVVVLSRLGPLRRRPA